MTVLLIVLTFALLLLVLSARPARGYRSQQPLGGTLDRDDQRVRDELRFRAQS